MVASVVAAGIVFAVGGYGVDEVMPLSVVAILQAALWTGLLGVPLWLVVVRGVRWVDLGWGATFRDACQGLTIGIVTSVFTAVTVTRMFVAHWLRTKRPTSINI